MRPIFSETTNGDGQPPGTTPEELAEAIIDVINAGASVINLSAALTPAAPRGVTVLKEALNYALRRGVITVAAAGNHGTIGASTVTGHPWVIPVVACDAQGTPLRQSNLGNSIGRRGLRAPGDNIRSLGTGDTVLTLGGTSAAAAFVTGAIALLWSEFRSASAAQIMSAVTHASAQCRVTVVPPLLNAWRAVEFMTS